MTQYVQVKVFFIEQQTFRFKIKTPQLKISLILYFLDEEYVAEYELDYEDDANSPELKGIIFRFCDAVFHILGRIL